MAQIRTAHARAFREKGGPAELFIDQCAFVGGTRSVLRDLRSRLVFLDGHSIRRKPIIHPRDVQLSPISPAIELDFHYRFI